MQLLLPGSPAVKEAIAKHRRAKHNVPVTPLSNDALRKKMHNFLRPSNATTQPANLADYWQGEEGRKAFFVWAGELYETEYRDGFSLTWRLGTDNVNYASKETVCWAPQRLVRLLGRNDVPRQRKYTQDLPRGVSMGDGLFYYRNLEREAFHSSCPDKLHFQFLADRRDYMVEVLESGIGPHLEKLLTPRIGRLNHAIENRIILDYI